MTVRGHRLEFQRSAISGSSRQWQRTTALPACGSSVETGRQVTGAALVRRGKQAQCRNFLQSAAPAWAARGSSRPLPVARRPPPCVWFAPQSGRASTSAGSPERTSAKSTRDRMSRLASARASTCLAASIPRSRGESALSDALAEQVAEAMACSDAPGLDGDFGAFPESHDICGALGRITRSASARPIPVEQRRVLLKNALDLPHQCLALRMQPLSRRSDDVDSLWMHEQFGNGRTTQ